jgi:hypothetical protein
MRLLGRIAIFVAPVALTALCRAALAASDAQELLLYHSNPAKIVDLSVDLILDSAAILLGVLLNVPKNGVLAKPGGGSITQADLAFCGFILVAALAALFFLVLAVRPIFGYADAHHVFSIWLPDAVGLSTLIVVVVRLT